MFEPVQAIVGRATEIEALGEAMAAVERERQFLAVELAGDPGMGKTRLLAELEREASKRRMLVLSGGASELDGELPFGVLVDALDAHIADLDQRQLEALDDDARPVLSRVFPSLHALAPGEASVPHDERYRTHRAIRQLLELLARDAPLVLVLDDLHWADSGSVDLIGSLLRHPPGAAVLIALAVRPHQMPDRLLAPLERARRAGFVRRVELNALTASASRQLLGDQVSDAQAAQLHEGSGGNPFYLQLLARVPAGREQHATGDVAFAGVEVPSAVAQALTEELALLDPTVRRVYEGAAVAGDPFEPEVAAAAADVPEETAVEALDELLRRDLARETDVPRRFRFRHPLVRRAVYDASPGGWRLQRARALRRRARRPRRVGHRTRASRRIRGTPRRRGGDRGPERSGQRGHPADAGGRRPLVRRRAAPAAQRRPRRAARRAARRAGGCTGRDRPLRGRPRAAARVRADRTASRPGRGLRRRRAAARPSR